MKIEAWVDEYSSKVKVSFPTDTGMCTGNPIVTFSWNNGVNSLQVSHEEFIRIYKKLRKEIKRCAE